MATCQVCLDAEIENPFSVPWDVFGKALMIEHFKEYHPEISVG